MRYLILGQGGREHAIVRALKFSASVSEIHVAPGSPGISQDAICHAVDLNDAAALAAFVSRYRFDCVVIGPERHLVDGLADRLRDLGINVVGPSAAAAQLEGSKAFAKDFMTRANVPTARSEVVSSVDEVMAAAERFAPPYVLKTDGLATGQGVFICADLDRLRAAATALFADRALGHAHALLQEHQTGYELSYLVLTNGEEFEALPLARDHRRLADGDHGPTTGGMGVVAPVAIDDVLRETIDRLIVAPTIAQLRAQDLLYRGVLYVSVMVTTDGPRVLGYNVRFGDPEAQVVLPLLEGDWGAVFKCLAQGELLPLRWSARQAACVVEAAPGYPDQPVRGGVIDGDLGHQTPSSYFLHAGTAKTATGQWVVDGGRVLNAVGFGHTRDEALDAAYAQARSVSWPGLQMRTDIGRA